MNCKCLFLNCILFCCFYLIFEAHSIICQDMTLNFIVKIGTTKCCQYDTCLLGWNNKIKIENYKKNTKVMKLLSNSAAIEKP